MNESNIKLLERMAQAGMNAAIPKFGSIAAPVRESSTAMLRKWADECKRLNLAFVPLINWWSVYDATWLENYNPVVTDSGKVLENTPCPYTRDFWDRSITPRLVAVSQALGEGDIAAVGIDMEMYGAEIADYTGGCYCDGCFSRYLQAKGRSGALPAPADRGRIIKEADELDAYQAVQREAARTFAAACREAFHKVRPGIRLAVLHLDQPIPLQEGLALGLGTPGLPVFCLTEKTYSNGYTPYIALAQESFREMGAFVDLLVGISQSRFSPANIAEQLYYSAHDSYGYWVYTMETFEMLDYHPLPGTPEEHWAGIEEANRELDRLGKDGNYQTSLRMRSFEPPPFPLPWSGFQMYDLVPRPGVPSSFPGAWLRKANWVYFYARQGDSIEFEMTRVQVGTYPDLPSIGMVSPTGVFLGEGTAKMDQPVVLQALAPETGVYGLVVESGGSAAVITRASHPYAVHIAQPLGARFVTTLSPLFVALSPDAATIGFEFVTETSAEAVKGTVFSESGAQLWSGVVEGPTKISLDRPAGTLVEIRFEQLPDHLMDDVHVRGGQGVLPFAATDPAGLLVGK
jgi:hypothetical protein